MEVSAGILRPWTWRAPRGYNRISDYIKYGPNMPNLPFVMNSSSKSRALDAGILVVDDVADTRELLAEALEIEGYAAIVAQSATEALQRMGVILPNLVITDFMMPEMSGVDLLKVMRQTPRLRDVPTIVVSAADTALVRHNVKAAGVSPVAILQKPIHLEALLSSISRALAFFDGSSTTRAATAG